jgi:rubrerythrin
MSKSHNLRDKPLLGDSSYDLIHQLEKTADFLYSATEKYLRDAEKDGKPELVKLWNSIKEDEQNHLKMLRNELIKEVKENTFG